MATITVAGVRLSSESVGLLEAVTGGTGRGWAPVETLIRSDLEALRSCALTRESLEARCLEGTDEGSAEESGWREYVEALADKIAREG